MLFNLAISSYTPTLSALLAPPREPASFSGIMAVGQTSTPGFSYLPETVAELNHIEKVAEGLHFTRLDEQMATPEATLAGLGVHSWVHFACHATQNANPSMSAFHLHGGTLNLETITRKTLKNADLAFLSACETATGDEKLPEEAVHLAAGMNIAGYPTVIATMWSIQDQDAPLIAQKVYAHLLEGGVPDARRAAKALHTAVRYLRTEIGVKAFARWAPYIHIGL
jgi:CHAT domain-containing protein